MKRCGPFTEPPEFEDRRVAVLIPFPKISSYLGFGKDKSPCFQGFPCLSFQTSNSGWEKVSFGNGVFSGKPIF